MDDPFQAQGDNLWILGSIGLGEIVVGEEFACFGEVLLFLGVLFVKGLFLCNFPWRTLLQKSEVPWSPMAL